MASLRLDPALPESPLLETVAPAATRIRVGPLSAGALHRAIRVHLGRSLPRPVLLRVHQLTGGNPFYALELARSLADAPEVGVALPSTLERLTGERLARLAEPVRRTLEPAALLANPTATLLGRLGDDPTTADRCLDAAVAEGVIEIEADRIRFAHPLLAEGMATMIGPRRRRLLHRELAELVVDPEERARHLALASDAPDAHVARALDEAAWRSRARGAPDAAAELAELARRCGKRVRTSRFGAESTIRSPGLRSTGAIPRARQSTVASPRSTRREWPTQPCAQVRWRRSASSSSSEAGQGSR
jgi:predicted ATPase